MANFKLNQNKIFLNNSSFSKHDQSLNDYIIDHNLDSLLLSSSSKSPTTSKIASSDLYSNALKYKKLINDEFVKSKQKSPKRKEKDTPAESQREKIGLLQIPLSSKLKNPINTNEDVSFLRFEDIEKHNSDIIPKDNKSLSLPRLHQKYQILKNSYEFQGQNTNLIKSSAENKPNNKMIFDIEVTHNKEIFQGLSKKIKEERNEKFNNLENNIQESRKVMVKMPPVRSYPMVKMNKITFKTNKELDDLDTKGQNTTTSGIVVKEKTEKSAKIPKYRIHWSLGEIFTWKPEVRESASFILDGHKGVLYGGLGTKVMDDVVVLDFDKMEWTKINDTGDRYSMGKFGHSAVRFKRKMYVFGGGTSFQSQMRQKECLAEVRALNLDDFTWSWIKCTGDLIIPRRNHTAETVGKHMIVHGGLNYKNAVLNDVWLFDFAHQKWSQANMKNPAQALAYHSSCSVYYLQRTRLEAYKGLDRKIAENNGDIIKYEGLYFFGGKNSKNEVVNNLYILEIHKTPMTWWEPETLGKPPSARCGHTLNFCPQFGLLVVIGGKDDKCLGRPFCNDICVLDLSNMNWLKLRIFGLTLVPARAFHSSAIINSKLYIFGGYNQKGYVNNELNIVEFDPKTIRDVLNAEKEKRLLKKLQERILQEKMERHKKKNKGVLDHMIPRPELHIQPTQDTESDEMGGSFDEMSPEINLGKPRKGATLLKQSIQDLLTKHNDNVNQNKWKLILDQFNHKNFVSYMPLPQPSEKRLPFRAKASQSGLQNLRRSTTLGGSGDTREEQEMDLEKFVSLTSSEKNIKVADTLKILDKIR